MSATLAAVTELAPKIAGRSEQIERDRGLPADLLAELAAAGCLRMLSPREYGGDELPLAEVVRVVGELARADAAVGWSVGQHCSAQLILGGFPAATVAEVYADGPDVLIAGAVAPRGRALPVEGGWRVSGRWPFVTGCRWSSWIYANCLVADGDAEPTVRLVLMRAEDVRVVDTWSVTGLCGTGSHDVVIQGVCPEERSCALPGSAGGAVTEHPRLLHGSFLLAAVSLGIARRALDEVLTLVAENTGKPGRGPAPTGELGSAHLTLKAAEALLAEQVAAADDPARLARASALATAGTATGTAKRVVSDLFALGGSASVYEASALQRLLRDIHVAGQHFLNRPHTAAEVGAALLASV
jgi:alkylation response protein AidB-like acyl-CoA dehydrogenase